MNLLELLFSIPSNIPEILMFIVMWFLVGLVLYGLLYLIDSSFLKMYENYGEVVDKEFTPEHTRRGTIIVNNAVIPTSTHHDDSWDIEIEYQGRVGSIEVTEEKFNSIEVGQRILIQFSYGRLFKNSIYIKDLPLSYTYENPIEEPNELNIISRYLIYGIVFFIPCYFGYEHIFKSGSINNNPYIITFNDKLPTGLVSFDVDLDASTVTPKVHSSQNNEPRPEIIKPVFHVIKDPNLHQDPKLENVYTFDASASIYPKTKSMIFEWDFGDGNTLTTISPIVTYKYERDGQYVVKLKLKENLTNIEDGNSTEHSIKNRRPIASFQAFPTNQEN